MSVEMKDMQELNFQLQKSVPKKFRTLFQSALENKKLDLNRVLTTRNEVLDYIIPFLMRHKEVSTVVLNYVFDMESMQALASNTALISLKFIIWRDHPWLRREKNAMMSLLTLRNDWFVSHWNVERIEVLVAYLKISTSIRVLDMHENGINSEKLESLVKGLRENQTLTHLDLGDNHIETASGFWEESFGFGTRGIKALADYLELNTTLTFLDLSGNSLHSQAQILAKGLKKNTTLTSLNLMRNLLNYQGKGFSETAGWLKQNRTLKHLDLSSNDLEDATSMTAIREIVEKNTNLISINLDDCYQQKQQMEEINTLIDAHHREQQRILITTVLGEYDKSFSEKNISILIFSYAGCSASRCNLCLMSEEIRNTPTLAEEGNLYLAENGQYITCYKGKIYQDSLLEGKHGQDIDLNQLFENLSSRLFKQRILEITSKRGHTCISLLSKVEKTRDRNSCFSCPIM